MSNPTDQAASLDASIKPIPSADAPINSEAVGKAADTEETKSSKVSLADLCAKGTSKYAVKNYSEAMDWYAQASELQAEINGEMAPENAEILFLYGRCLYKVGQSKSDILGGKSEKKKPKSKKPKAAKLGAVTEGDETKENGAVAEQSKPDEAPEAPKPYADGPRGFFSFTGDENFEDSDDDEDAEGDEDDEEEEDELLLGFEILDLARVLFERRLQQPEEVEEDSKGKGKATEEDSSLTKHVKERLADTHDLLGDISLENERFPQAIGDFKASLAYKQELYTKDHEIIAEAHFKLSLALEFGSITTTADADDGNEKKEAGEATVNEEMRAEAASQLELAIESTKLKLHNKEVSLAETSVPEDNNATRRQIADVKEILSDMEQRLVELRAPTVDMNAVLGDVMGSSNGLGSGSIADTKQGESRADVEARIEEAKKNANNLQGLARKKAPKAPQDTPAETQTNGKRKAEDEAEGESKKAKVDE